jgi:hypothetical protein
MTLIEAIKANRGTGRIALIWKVSRAMGIHRDLFDAIMKKHILDYSIQLTGGDPSTMTDDQIRDSYIDHLGELKLGVIAR